MPKSARRCGFEDVFIGWLSQSPQSGLRHAGGVSRAVFGVLQSMDVNRQDNQVHPPGKSSSEGLSKDSQTAARVAHQLPTSMHQYPKAQLSILRLHLPSTEEGLPITPQHKGEASRCAVGFTGDQQLRCHVQWVPAPAGLQTHCRSGLVCAGTALNIPHSRFALQQMAKFRHRLYIFNCSVFHGPPKLFVF